MTPDTVHVPCTYQVMGLLQAGDEDGPVAGEVGYGEEAPNATVQVRGQTSSSYTQKNYKVELKKGKGTWRQQRAIALNKHMGEGMRFRNKMAYDLIRGIPQMMGLRTQFVHLYVKDLTDSASGVFEEGSHDDVRTHIGGFHRLHEFSVAVIHHADHVRLNTFNEGDQFADPLYGQGGSGLVALGSLDRYQMSFLIDILTDFIVIKASVRQQVYLAISHTVFCQRSLRRADTDDFFQRIIGFAYRGQQFVSRS
mgnify:CR=1 FL=1